ncbi:MAG: MaoC family dehydratase [Actinomycetota bacterium]|nr:MaoC family dehydratase [Actinomycetota bacterium]
MNTTTTTMAELPSLVGQDLGLSDWFDITQDTVNNFADATGDHQWIHVDVDRATTEGPFGGPVEHGYLTLSLLVPMHKQILTVTDAQMTVNYGVNKVRFPFPVPVGSQIRTSATLLDVTGGLQITVNCVIEAASSTKPVCVAEPLFRFYLQPPRQR